MSALLSLRHVSLNLGGVQALQDISLEIFTGEQVAFIGANGSKFLRVSRWPSLVPTALVKAQCCAY